MKKILIVDDDDLFREMLQEMVTREGYTVRVACNGQEGLEAVRSWSPDLLITDILMPEKDGIELITELQDQYQSLPIIAVSGGRRTISMEFNLESARLIGVRATLAKPFSREQLRKAIEQAMD